MNLLLKLYFVTSCYACKGFILTIVHKEYNFQVNLYETKKEMTKERKPILAFVLL